MKRFPRLSETFILDEILRLEAAGLHIAVDSLKDPGDQPRHPQFDRVRAHVRYVSRSGNQAQAVARRATEGGFDRIHAHFATLSTEVAISAGRLAGLPVTATFHARDIFHRDYAPSVATKLASLSAVVTVSRYNADHLRSFTTGTPVHVVYNGVDDTPQPGPNPSGPVLCVARLVSKKGIDVLIRAIGVLARRGVNRELVIVGEGELRGRLEDLARRLGVEDRVRFAGALTKPDVERAYAEASMFVLPCRIDEFEDRDGMPTVLGEAMRHGLPVVSTDVIGIPELVRHGETGLLVDPDDPAAVADAISRLDRDLVAAAELGRKGADHAAALLDPRVATDSLLEIFGGRV